MKIIGSADEFWRVRITRVDTSEDLDFSWRDDVLYRSPSAAPARERHLFHVEAVHVEDRDTKRLLKTFERRNDAEEFAQTARTALTEITKSRFEDTYFTDELEGDDASPETH